MKEFLGTYYVPLLKGFEILAALVGILLYKKYKNTEVKYFIWFLIWIVFVEAVGSYPRYLINLGLFHKIEGTLIERNYWWYSLFWTSASSLFYPWFLRQKIKSSLFKKIIKYGCIIYLIILTINLIFYFRDFFESNSMSLILSNLFLILLSSIFYLYEVLSSEKILNFYRSVYFYVAAIIFVWWLVSTPLGFFEVYNTTADWDYVVLKWIVMLSCIVFMYLGFSIALIVSKPEYD